MMKREMIEIARIYVPVKRRATLEQAHDKRPGQQRDGAPDHPGLVQHDRQHRRREPGDRQPDA